MSERQLTSFEADITMIERETRWIKKGGAHSHAEDMIQISFKAEEPDEDADDGGASEHGEVHVVNTNIQTALGRIPFPARVRVTLTLIE